MPLFQRKPPPPPVKREAPSPPKKEAEKSPDSLRSGTITFNIDEVATMANVVKLLVSPDRFRDQRTKNVINKCKSLDSYESIRIM